MSAKDAWREYDEALKKWERAENIFWSSGADHDRGVQSLTTRPKQPWIERQLGGDRMTTAIFTLVGVVMGWLITGISYSMGRDSAATDKSLS